MLSTSVQFVLFSATFPEEVQNFAADFAPEANQLFLKQEEVTVDAIKQLYLECHGEDQKYNALAALYDCMTIGQSIVFCKVSSTPFQVRCIHAKSILSNLG
jgi:ATP-dependent RNA helicase DDX19/DBP5